VRVLEAAFSRAPRSFETGKNDSMKSERLQTAQLCSNCVGESDRRATYEVLQYIARIASGIAILLNLQKPLTSLARVHRRWLIARSRIFDRKWYRAEYPESGAEGLDPIMHYLLSGADRGYRPHLLFDPAWYMNARGPRQRDQNPLVDYINYGAREGIEPSPYFATPFYRKAAGGTSGLTPLGHFVAYGLPRGLAPTPLFDRAWYLENNPDVRRAGFDPFLHFVVSGDRDGRSPGPLFDSAWYWMNNVDARDEGMEPLRHYLAIGARQGRDPSRFFDTEFYVAAHRGQGAARETALTFYAERGRDGWHSTHPVLPPPASPSAYFEELPWQKSIPAPGAIEAPFRTLIVDVGEAAGRETAGLGQLLTMLVTLPGLDVYCVTDASMASIPGVAILDLSRPNLALLDRSVVLERVLRAMKFRDPKGLVCEAVCAALPLARTCAGIGLPYHNLMESRPLAAADWAELLAHRVAYRPSRHMSISVIVPNYNHARYLDERLASILEQRLRPDEIIFLDDGSSDGSLEIARAWQARSPIHFAIAANATNSGSPFKQWANGIESAAGDLVWIAESDDSSCPRFLERMAAAFMDPDIAVAYCDSEVIGTDGEILSPTYRFYTDSLSKTKWLAGYVESGPREIAEALAIKNTIPNVSAVLFRRDALNESLSSAKGFRYCGDWAIYVACLRKGKIAFCPRTLNKHRRPPGSLTHEGERDAQGVREAIAIKLSIFASAPRDERVIWLSLAQTVFEYEIRSKSGGRKRPAFTRNKELADCVEKLRSFLGGQGHQFPEDTSEIAAYLRGVAAHSASLRATDHPGFVDSVLQELKTIAVRG
jgi:glycosyltransferase involved in cell wall biosynthesis